MTKIGFRIPNALAKKAIGEIAAWAADTGFEAIDIGRPDSETVKAVRRAGLEIGTFDLPGTSLLLSADAAQREAGAQTIAGAAAQARDLGLSRAFGVLIPPDNTQSRADSFTLWQKGWPKVSDTLAGAGIAFALEGWPGIAPYYPALGVTPESVRAMLAFDSAHCAGALKLNYDPSHLARLGIDPLRFLHEFGAHVVHAHGKDTAFDTERLYETGRLGTSLRKDAPGSALKGQMDYGGGWWRYCIPGDGTIDWAGVAAGLHAQGFNGIISVELEDARYHGTEDSEQKGLRRAREYLSRFFA